jgi:hypothetical protein
MDWETASYIVTVFGLPLAIAFFVLERRKQHFQEDEEIYLRLSDEYVHFLELALENADLNLLDPAAGDMPLDAEQRGRKMVLLGILISLFERAYILSYEEKMSPGEARRWRSWEDYMREWCRRPDFRAALDEHLPGEDPEFVAYITRIAREKAQSAP